MACVNIPALSLQYHLRRHPHLRQRAAVILDRDRASGQISELNAIAHRYGIRRGMRYATALTLHNSLHAAVLPPDDLTKAVNGLTSCLLHFSPVVEPSTNQPGVFWLDAQGLQRLYPSLQEWALTIRQQLSSLGYTATVIVGFSRFGTYAIAQYLDGVHTFTTPSAEADALRNVPLNCLNLPTDVARILTKLDIKTLDTFMQLPQDQVAQRFGLNARHLQCLASNQLWQPLHGVTPPRPLIAQYRFPEPVTSQQCLLLTAEHLLQTRLTSQTHTAIRAMRLHFILDNGHCHREIILPAAATSDCQELLELVTRRLSVLSLPCGVTELKLEVKTAPRHSEQLSLFPVNPTRDLSAGHRSLARLRARLGNTAVVRPQLECCYLPEGQFTWLPVTTVTLPSPRPAAPRSLVRRIYTPPVALETKTVSRSPRQFPPSFRHIRGGPYRLSSSWWDHTIVRDYYFVTANDATLQWVYYDRVTHRWFLQGIVD